MKLTYRVLLPGVLSFLFYLPTGWAQPTGHTHPHGAMATAQGSSDNAEFTAKMDKIMLDMHQGMSDVALTGNKDIDFMIMMIPHHQGAIDMSKLILESSQDKEVQNMALGIITEQENEIAIMNQLIKEKKNAH